MNIGIAENVKWLRMERAGQESLAQYVSRIRHEKGLSLTQVQARSGDTIASSYVSRIENGWVKNPSAAKLCALARGLGVSEDELFAIARGTKEPEGFRESRFWTLYQEVQKIQDEAQRRLVEGMLDGVFRAVNEFPDKKADSFSPRPEAARKSH